MNTPEGRTFAETRVVCPDGAWLSVYQCHAPARSLLVVLPVATHPTLVGRGLDALAARAHVVCWEGRLVTDPTQDLRAPDQLSASAQASDVGTLLDALGVATADLLGYCSGASVALRAAAVLGPSRIRRLVLANGAYFLPEGRCTQTQYERDIQGLVPLVAGGRAAASTIHARFIARLVGRWTGHEFGTEILRPYRDAESFYRFVVALDQLLAGDQEGVAAQVRVPTLLLAGARDDQTHDASAEVIAARIPGARLQVGPEWDHYELCRARPDFMDAIADFLEEP